MEWILQRKDINMITGIFYGQQEKFKCSQMKKIFFQYKMWKQKEK